MGLKTGAFAKIWAIENKGNYSDARVSISKKNKTTGAYEQDFSGFLRFIGNAHSKATSLKEGDRIKIGDFEVTTTYDAAKKITYTNYALFSFETENGEVAAPVAKKQPKPDVELPQNEDDPF